jgi:hypothetical protein
VTQEEVDKEEEQEEELKSCLIIARKAVSSQIFPCPVLSGDGSVHKDGIGAGDGYRRSKLVCAYLSVCWSIACGISFLLLSLSIPPSFAVFVFFGGGASDNFSHDWRGE